LQEKKGGKAARQGSQVATLIPEDISAGLFLGGCQGNSREMKQCRRGGYRWNFKNEAIKCSISTTTFFSRGGGGGKVTGCEAWGAQEV